MAGKSKKAKKRKRAQRRRQAGAQPADVSALHDAVTSRRGRRAMALLKKLGGDAPEKLAAQTYALRIRELLDDGHDREARDMFASRFQASSGLFAALSDDEKLAILVGCGPAEFWANPMVFGIDDAALQNYLASTLRDPTVICSNEFIPSDNPIKQDAGNLVAAWQAVDGENYVLARELLGKIGRRSVMKDWRLFVQALIAYHEMDDSGIEAALARISTSSPAAELAAELRVLSAGKCSGAIDEKGKRLFQQAVTSKGAAVSRAANKLASYFIGKNESILAAELISRITNYDGSSFHCAQEISGLVMARIANRHRGDAYDRCEAAEDAAELVQHSGITKLEHALVLDLVLDCWISAFLSSFGWGYMERHVRCSWAPWKYEVDELEPEEMFGVIYDLAEKTLNLKPLPQTFERLAAFADEEDLHALLQPLLSRWGKSFAGDAAALRKALGYYRRTKAFDCALATYEQLRKLEGGMGNDALNATMQLEAAAGKLKDDPREAAKVKDVAVAEPWQQILKDTIIWMSSSNRKEKVAAGKVLAGHERPTMIEDFALRIDPDFKRASLPQGVRNQVKANDAVGKILAGVEEQHAIDDDVWKLSLHDPLPTHIDNRLDVYRLNAKQLLMNVKFLLRHTDIPRYVDTSLATSAQLMRLLGKGDGNAWLARAACYAGFVLNGDEFVRNEVDERIRTLVRIAMSKKGQQLDDDLLAYLERCGYPATTEGRCPNKRLQKSMFGMETYIDCAYSLGQVFTPTRPYGPSPFDMPFPSYDDDFDFDIDDFDIDDFDIDDFDIDGIDDLDAAIFNRMESMFNEMNRTMNPAFKPGSRKPKKKAAEERPALQTPMLDKLDSHLQDYIKGKKLSDTELAILDKELEHLNIKTAADIPARILKYGMTRPKSVNINSHQSVMRMVIDYVEDTFLKQTYSEENQ